MPRVLVVILALAFAVVLTAGIAVVAVGAWFVPARSVSSVDGDPGGTVPEQVETVFPAPTPTVVLETPVPAATPTPEATVAPTPRLPATSGEGGLNQREALFKSIVDKHLGDLPGEFGVVVKDLKTGDIYTQNADKPFPTASLYKLGLMYEVLKEAKEGKLDLKTKMTIEPRHMSQSEFDEKLPVGLTVTIDRSLWFLITLSSNSAAMALHDYVSWTAMNNSLRAAGFTNLRMTGDPTEKLFGDWRDQHASSTPNDILRFFELVYGKKLLDEEASEKMMYLLRNQQVDDRLSVKLPRGVVMAHKTGNLSGVVNDVGIIFGPKTDLYVGVMTQGADYESTTNALQNLGLALYQAVN